MSAPTTKKFEGVPLSLTGEYCPKDVMTLLNLAIAWIDCHDDWKCVSIADGSELAVDEVFGAYSGGDGTVTLPSQNGMNPMRCYTICTQTDSSVTVQSQDGASIFSPDGDNMGTSIDALCFKGECMDFVPDKDGNWISIRGNENNGCANAVVHGDAVQVEVFAPPIVDVTFVDVNAGDPGARGTIANGAWYPKVPGVWEIQGDFLVRAYDPANTGVIGYLYKVGAGGTTIGGSRKFDFKEGRDQTDSQQVLKMQETITLTAGQGIRLGGNAFGGTFEANPGDVFGGIRAYLIKRYY